ncbi:MAG: DUF2142 domain-containing protein [Chloroflexota bacterium]
MIIDRLKSHPLQIILVVYLLLASLYSVVTPIFEASDELWHYPAVKYMADHGLQLPVQDPKVETEWRQEGSQPPLYYMISAILTRWIDTSDYAQAHKANPHRDIGIIVPDGNVNMMVHDPAVEAFPWRGTVLAVHLIRFFSVILGAVTVAMTYLLTAELFLLSQRMIGLSYEWAMTYPLTAELFPGRRWLASAAALFTALNPMFLFISGSVNNDNLSNALGAVLLLLIVRLLKRRDAPPLRDLVLIGVITGAGMLAKFNIGFMVILIVFSLALIAYRLRDWRPLIVGGLITGGLTIVIAGWWYVRNVQLYGDPTGLNVFIHIVGPRSVPANWAQLWTERHTFLMSYWGFFGGVNVPMPEIVYSGFNVMAALAAVGLVIGLGMWLARRSEALTPGPSPKGEGNLGGVKHDWTLLLGRAFTVIWIVVLFISLLRWTSETWASQGRLMFSAIAPLSMWMAVGLGSLPLRRVVIGVSLTWFALIAVVLAPFTIQAAYDVPLKEWVATWNMPSSNPCDSDAHCNTVFFYEPQQAKPSLSVVYLPQYGDIYPNQYLKSYQAYFHVEGNFTRDWSAFIHLENAQGLIVAQRDIYPQQGLTPTTLLKADEGWFNDFVVRIPELAYTPQELNIYLGFYDNFHPQDRMIAKGKPETRTIPEPPQVTSDNRVLLGTVKLLPQPSTLDMPNPMRVNFGDEAELIGYDVSSLVMYPSKKVKVTFYWRELRPMRTDYRVFTQILEPGTPNTFGRSDGMPANWTRPTTTWKVGEIIKDEHEFTINADAPPGTWQLEVGMYQLAGENQFHRLRIITPDGAQAEDAASLTRIKMNPALEPF